VSAPGQEPGWGLSKLEMVRGAGLLSQLVLLGFQCGGTGWAAGPGGLNLDLDQMPNLGTSSTLSLVSPAAMEATICRECTSVFEQSVGAPRVVYWAGG